MLDGTTINDTANGRVCKVPTEPWIVFTAGVMVRNTRRLYTENVLFIRDIQIQPKLYCWLKSNCIRERGRVIQ